MIPNNNTFHVSYILQRCMKSLNKEILARLELITLKISKLNIFCHFRVWILSHKGGYRVLLWYKTNTMFTPDIFVFVWQKYLNEFDMQIADIDRKKQEQISADKRWSESWQESVDRVKKLYWEMLLIIATLYLKTDWRLYIIFKKSELKKFKLI